MKKTNQLLSTVFILLVLFLNIGLSLSLNHGLHAHSLGDNKILVHYHHSPLGTHSHHSDDDSSSSFSFSTTLTYLNDTFSISLTSVLKFVDAETNFLWQDKFCSNTYQYSFWRGPPMAYNSLLFMAINAYV